MYPDSRTPPRCLIQAYNKIVCRFPMDVRLSVATTVARCSMMDSTSFRVLGSECAKLEPSKQMYLALYQFAICRLVAKVIVLAYAAEYTEGGEAAAAAAFGQWDDVACRAGGGVHASMFEHMMGIFSNEPQMHTCAGVILNRAFEASVERDFYFS